MPEIPVVVTVSKSSLGVPGSTDRAEKQIKRSLEGSPNITLNFVDGTSSGKILASTTETSTNHASVFVVPSRGAVEFMDGLHQAAIKNPHLKSASIFVMDAIPLKAPLQTAAPVKLDRDCLTSDEFSITRTVPRLDQALEMSQCDQGDDEGRIQGFRQYDAAVEAAIESGKASASTTNYGSRHTNVKGLCKWLSRAINLNQTASLTYKP